MGCPPGQFHFRHRLQPCRALLAPFLQRFGFGLRPALLPGDGIRGCDPEMLTLGGSPGVQHRGRSDDDLALRCVWLLAGLPGDPCRTFATGQRG